MLPVRFWCHDRDLHRAQIAVFVELQIELAQQFRILRSERRLRLLERQRIRNPFKHGVQGAVGAICAFEFNDDRQQIMANTNDIDVTPAIALSPIEQRHLDCRSALPEARYVSSLKIIQQAVSGEDRGFETSFFRRQSHRLCWDPARGVEQSESLHGRPSWRGFPCRSKSIIKVFDKVLSLFP